MIVVKVMAGILLWLPLCLVAFLSFIATIPGTARRPKGITPLHMIRWATILIWLALTGLYVWFLVRF